MSTTILVGQAPTNLGPLTTTFTPPAACTVAVGAVDGGLLGLLGGAVPSIAFLGQSCSRGKGVDATTCWPPTSSGAQARSAPPLNGWGFYSPGVHCPAGYATACSATGGSGGGSGWPVQFRLLDGETAVGCCPSGYGCGNINGQTCTMIATSTTVPTVTCDGTKSGDFAFQTVPDAEASITAFSLFAPMIQINWQSSDRAQADSTTTEAGAAAGSTATATNPTRTGVNQPVETSGTQTIDTAVSLVPTLETDGSQSQPHGTSTGTGTGTAEPGRTEGASTDAEQPEPTDSGNGLATTTKVGLGIGGAVAALALVIGTVMYVWRRRRSSHEEQELDRLYGMKHAVSSSSDLTGTGARGDDSIPGWYRGQRQAPTLGRLMPTADPYGGAGADQLEVPASPYYRPYRP
ncbi:hypothetical protein B0H67DRAFT_474827 [Lasiosphaeris hirsuta]|uniref:Uncharacterized protein n=1 Tax=Lasiosphaeris hirsuta TaxID=260670 RepID=A0AA40E9P9_9PEZI|nr:hypothetical protein B0H67DRAFT_474827 [Lasiosphaeris hirsuta]